MLALYTSKTNEDLEKIIDKVKSNNDYANAVKTLWKKLKLVLATYDVGYHLVGLYLDQPGKKYVEEHLKHLL